MNASDNASVVGADLLMNQKRSGRDDAASIKSYSQSGSDAKSEIVVDFGGSKAKHSAPSSSGSEDRSAIKRIKKSKRRVIPSSSASSASASISIDDDSSSENSMTSDSSGSSGSSSSFSDSSSEDGGGRKRLSQEDIMNMKRELLYQFDRMDRKGIKVPKKFTLASSLEEMQCEYERLKHDRETEMSVRFQRKALMAIITGVEFLNSRFDPFDIKLDGWSESVHDNINEYDDVFEELYAKYRGKAKMAPELKLMLMLSGSAFMFHLNNTMFRSSYGGMEHMMKPGGVAGPPPPRNGGGGGLFGGLMGSLMGGGGGLASLFGGGGGPPPMPPPQPTNQMPARTHMRGPTNVDDILNEVNAMNAGGMPMSGMMPDMMHAGDRIETMSTISDAEFSELPDDASVSGVFNTGGRGRKGGARGKSMNI